MSRLLTIVSPERNVVGSRRVVRIPGKNFWDQVTQSRTQRTCWNVEQNVGMLWRFGCVRNVGKTACWGRMVHG